MKISWENEASKLLISRGAPVKVQSQSLKFDCKYNDYYPHLFLFNYNMALLGVIFPPLMCVPCKRTSKVCHVNFQFSKSRDWNYWSTKHLQTIIVGQNVLVYK